jgi:uncharacterized protein
LWISPGANSKFQIPTSKLHVSPVLTLITFLAAIVNGALGYGFSSITVPLALLLVPNRILNPSLVAVEVVLNAYVLWVNRDAVGRVRSLAAPVMFGLAPGVAAGALVVARVDPTAMKLATYLALLPMILVQAAGYRRPIRAEGRFAVAFGAGIGVLYATTTISGPPLAVLLNNQGLARREFRAALGLIRLTESTLTAVAYAAAGLFTGPGLALLPSVLPGVAVGVPIGAFVIHHVQPETFRRMCMSFDAWVVAFGLSTLARQIGWIEGGAAYSILAAVVLIDSCLLYRFFRTTIDTHGQAT